MLLRQPRRYRFIVDSDTVLKVEMTANGGQAIRITWHGLPARDEDSAPSTHTANKLKSDGTY